MDRLHVPKSSVAISRLGFGCARLFGGRELRNSARLIEAAISCGIRHFDTAPAYGSEDVLGEILADARDITIATKIGLPRSNKQVPAAKRVFASLYRSTLRPLLGRVPAVKSRLLRLTSTQALTNASILKRQLHRDDVLRELDESLRLLRRTRIDLYLIHEPEGIEITDELREAFLSLQKDGIIGAFGLAFGGLPTEFGSFGTVEQCRFPGDSLAVPVYEKVRVYHGVVRFGLQDRTRDGTDLSAAKLIAQALERDPGSAVIFSASSGRQIRQISNDLSQSGLRTVL
jgi:hypothetical protein